MILGKGESEEMAMRRMKELYVRAVGWEKRADSLLIGGADNEVVSPFSPFLLEISVYLHHFTSICLLLPLRLSCHTRLLEVTDVDSLSIVAQMPTHPIFNITMQNALPMLAYFYRQPAPTPTVA